MNRGRPRRLDYVAVARLRRKGIAVAVIAQAFGVTREAVYHVLRRGPGPGPASSAELREALRSLVEAVEGTPVAGLAAPARALLERGTT